MSYGLQNTTRHCQRAATWTSLAAIAIASSALAMPGEDDGAPIADLLQAQPADVQEFNEHITVLSSAAMGGRLPGTPGMELAKRYMDMYFEAAGLEPPFQDLARMRMSYRQPFEMGEERTMSDQELSAIVNGKMISFKLGEDYELTGMGSAASLTADAVFVGYSIEEGPDEYSSFNDDDDLTGKIAVMLRFEPMDENGKSKWSNGGPWTARAGFMNKIRTVARRNPAGMILINTPGADDPRIEQLISDAAQITEDFPIFMMTPDAAERFVADGDGNNLHDLIEMANDGRSVVDLAGAKITMMGNIDAVPSLAENVGGLLPGRGTLADELIVVGAHLDHLGYGAFGSREGPGNLHPGADDNASGAVAVMMMASELARRYEAAPDDANLRSVLFVGFSAEESGLNGSRYYVDHPIRDISQHTLMINFDMIGRVRDDVYNLAGVETGEGMREIFTPVCEASELEVSLPERMSGASDHTSFNRRGVPVLFGNSGLHEDYHTSKDTHDKINRVGATKVVRLMNEVLHTAATHPTRFPIKEGGGGGRGGGPTGGLKVRMGVRTEAVEGDGKGLLITTITPGTSADEAGLLPGDIILMWDKEEVNNRRELLERLRGHEPGDEVKLFILRDGEDHTIMMTLKARQ